MGKPALYFFLMLVLLQVQWGLVLHLAPYRSSHDNRLALFALSGLLLASACGLYVSAAGLSAGGTLPIDTSIVQGVAALVNAGVFVAVVVEAWRGSFGPLVRRVVLRRLPSGLVTPRGPPPRSEGTSARVTMGRKA